MSGDRDQVLAASGGKHAAPALEATSGELARSDESTLAYFGIGVAMVVFTVATGYVLQRSAADAAVLTWALTMLPGLGGIAMVGLGAARTAKHGLGVALPQHEGARRLLLVIDRCLGFCEQLLLAIWLAALMGASIGRKLADLSDAGWPGADEMIRYFVFFSALTGAALAAQQERQISMDFVTRMLARRPRAILRQLLRVFVIGMCLLLAYGGNALRVSSAADHGEFLDPPTALWALPIGALLIAAHMLLHTLIDLTYFATGTLPPEPEQVAH